MNRIPIYLCLISVLLLLGVGATPGQETTTIDFSNPFVGTWVLNLDKSASPIGWKSGNMIIEAQDNGLKIMQDGVRSDGSYFHWETSPKFDGKFYPIIGQLDATNSLRRIDTNSYEIVHENGSSYVAIISEDGMTLTRTQKFHNQAGQELTLTLVYDRQ